MPDGKHTFKALRIHQGKHVPAGFRPPSRCKHRQGVDPADFYSDKVSGTKQHRPRLDALLKVARSGDTITVHSLDRLGHSALHVFQTIVDLEGKAVMVKSPKESEEAHMGATGELVRKLLFLVAELERNERRASGRG